MRTKKDSQTKKQTKKVDYRVISFILFTIGFFSIFAIRPSVSLIYNLQKEKSEYEKVNQTLETKIQKIIATQAQFMQLINNKTLVEQALPDTHNINITRELLDNQLEINNFAIQKITILPKTTNQLGVVVINLSGLGAYEDVLAFLSYINNSRRLLTVDSLGLEPEKGSSQSGTIVFNSVLNTFYYSGEN